MKRITKRMKEYLAPGTRAVRVSIENSVCAGSEVTKIKTDKPNIEVDEWDTIGNDISFD